MLNRDLANNGYCFISSSFYCEQKDDPSLNTLKNIFAQDLEEDGLPFRKRAYIKLCWDKKKNTLSKHRNQHYFQTLMSNTVDGGKQRVFKSLPENFLKLPILKTILDKNLALIAEHEDYQHEQELIFGLHFIRYNATDKLASYSSPAWLHKDDEPLVFIHLVNLSDNALGGDNLIADNVTKNVTQVIRLEDDIDTLVLNQNVYHAVTPLGSREGTAIRDVILFTIEPHFFKETR